MPFLEGKSQPVSDWKKMICENSSRRVKGFNWSETLEEAEKGAALESIAFVPL